MHKLKTRRCRTRSTLAAEGLGWIVGAFTAVVVMGLIGYMQ